MAVESSEGEADDKHIGGHLLVDDDLREMAKSLKFPLTSAATVLLLNKPATGARGQDPPRCQQHGLPVRLYEQDEEGKVGVLLSEGPDDHCRRSSEGEYRDTRPSSAISERLLFSWSLSTAIPSSVCFLGWKVITGCRHWWPQKSLKQYYKDEWAI